MSGKMQVGKNVAADFFIEKLKAKGMSVETDLFAHDLKNNCKNDFKKLAHFLNNYAEGLKILVNTFADVMTKNHMLDSLLNAIDQIKVTDENYFENKNGVTRALLQIYGTEIFRDRVDIDYWAKQVLNRSIKSKADAIVITDARFPNEINVFGDVDMDQIKVINIRVNRDTGVVDEHESETALDDFNEWNYIIDNNHSLAVLDASVDNVLNDVFNPDSSNDVPWGIFIDEGEDDGK